MIVALSVVACLLAAYAIGVAANAEHRAEQCRQAAADALDAARRCERALLDHRDSFRADIDHLTSLIDRLDDPR